MAVFGVHHIILLAVNKYGWDIGFYFLIQVHLKWVKTEFFLCQILLYRVQGQFNYHLWDICPFTCELKCCLLKRNKGRVNYLQDNICRFLFETV